ncbi:MAG: AAA family ATPase [Paludibacteraceae bacterium]|nr:AAA family ATPase [Paludibacteraceae bacterium]
MFTYLKLHNFKSFKDVTINLKKKDSFKHLAIIYGMNGRGKSTVVETFIALDKTMHSLSYKDMLFDILNKRKDSDESLRNQDFLEFLESTISRNSIEGLIKEYRTINTSDPMVIEYGFQIDGSSGSYLMEFDQGGLIRERLDYALKTRKVCCFEITSSETYSINQNLFGSTEFIDEFMKQLRMYWGKHSFFSVLNREIDDKSSSFIQANISSALRAILKAFDSISYCIVSDRDADCIRSAPFFADLQCGTIEKSEETKLDNLTPVLSKALESIFDDVKRAYYRKEEKDGKIHYELYLTKQIGSHSFDINFEYESRGTQEILHLLPFLMLAVNGYCVVIDEFGNGIHDFLSAELIQYIKPMIKGQLILTTHNTYIMDRSDVTPDSLYHILDEPKGRSVRCVTDIEERVHPNYNYRNRYITNPHYSGAQLKETAFDFLDFAEFYK